MANPFPANFETLDGSRRLTGQVNFTDSANQPGFQPYVGVDLRHSADFANINASAPVVATQEISTQAAVQVVLPPTAFGNNSHINVVVVNELGSAGAVKVHGVIVVQNADGTVWIEQDVAAAGQTIAVDDAPNLDFSLNGGSAGAGLSWDSTTKRVDIASAGVFSAWATVYAVPA